MKRSNNSGKHLTLDDRMTILKGIENNSSKSAIAETIGKDKSTVGKEIKLHRFCTHKLNVPMECADYAHCKYGRGSSCNENCPGYKPFKCSRRDRTPGVCNGCSKFSFCHFNKYKYDPVRAHKEYTESLVDSRTGVNLTVSEMKELAEKIRPYLKQGCSPYQIVQLVPDIGITEKTLYNYIELGLFNDLSDISVLDLRRQPSRKLPKKGRNEYKKRSDYKYLTGRKYSDYLEHIEIYPDSFVTQMDTVYNDGTSGPFIQTFKFVDANLLFGIYQKEKTSSSMVSGIDSLESLLGSGVFNKYASVILTDRGSEFSDAESIEANGRTHVFYCDPMRANQKGTLENNHILLRYILPKETDLYSLGLTSQAALNLALSHINSAPVEKLNGKSPLQYTKFLYPDLYKKITAFGIVPIPQEQLLLKPQLLKDFRKS